MKILTFNTQWLSVLLAAFLLLAPAFANNAAEQSTSTMQWFSGETVVADAWSQLVRNDNGFSMTLHSNQLFPGNVATVWWLIFNQPENCGHVEELVSSHRCTLEDVFNHNTEASLIYATGHVIGENGTGNFGAGLRANDLRNVIFGPGLTNPRGADVFLAIRDHGPALPGMIDNQIHEFDACNPDTGCINLQFSVHES